MKKRILLVAAVAIIATAWLANKIMHNIGLKDTGDITLGMSYTEYLEKTPEEERMDIGNYSYFVNNHGFPVLLRCVDDTVVQLQVIDLDKTRTNMERFEQIKEGMTLSDVSNLVGTPIATSTAHNIELIYNCQNRYMYTITYTEKEHVLYVESITYKDMG